MAKTTPLSLAPPHSRATAFLHSARSKSGLASTFSGQRKYRMGAADCRAHLCSQFTQSNNRRHSIRHSALAQVLSFHILADSFALTKNSTLLFSADTELFAQN